MRITAIEPAKGERFRLYTEDGYLCTLDGETILANHIHAGCEVDADTLNELDLQAQYRRGREKAYDLLGYRDHSRKELYDKLLRYISPQAAAMVCDLMEEQRFLNDEAYAQKYARYCLETKKWGARRAKYELIRKGIDPLTAEAALEACEVDTVAQICAIIEKKYTRFLNDEDPRAKKKLTAALMRLGYDYSDIREAVARCGEEAPEGEENWE